MGFWAFWNPTHGMCRLYGPRTPANLRYLKYPWPLLCVISGKNAEICKLQPPLERYGQQKQCLDCLTVKNDPFLLDKKSYILGVAYTLFLQLESVASMITNPDPTPSSSLIPISCSGWGQRGAGTREQSGEEEGDAVLSEGERRLR